MSKKSVLFLVATLLAAGILAGLIWFLKSNNQIRICDSLRPGIKAGDLISLFGSPFENTKTGEFWFRSSWVAAGPIRAKVNADGKVIMLKCSEDGPVNWAIS